MEDDKMREEEKIKEGILFCPGDTELKAIKLKTHKLNVDYNSTYEDEREKREEILAKMIGELGEGSFIQGPVFFHYGQHTKIGKHFFGNFNLTIQDDCVIGAGSVVTRDIPSGSFAAGVPCKVIRPLTEKDSMKYKPEVLADNMIL